MKIKLKENSDSLINAAKFIACDIACNFRNRYQASVG